MLGVYFMTCSWSVAACAGVLLHIHVLMLNHECWRERACVRVRTWSCVSVCWNDNIMLPDVDCGVKRDTGTCSSANEREQSILNLGSEAGVARGRCGAVNSMRVCGEGMLTKVLVTVTVAGLSR